ncbi:MAG: hypothetical protein C7B46_14990 [Sulfobacillus benefaciens]|uniref:Uncharacterized protein n=1 Tax=Sulfobacillus benefaciens TaxID=453960 RepID=A0A2T2XCN5_9FIRM|nr:MAG: hypothetical protein C7B46_14990 [Sulfobacillus benefaciens]
MRSLTTLICFLVWVGGLWLLPHTSPFLHAANQWPWDVWTGVLVATSVTDLIWHRILTAWAMAGLVVSGAISLGFGVWFTRSGGLGLGATLGIALATWPVLWLLRARLAPGDWWLIAVGAVSLVGHPAYFALWLGLSLALAEGVGWLIFRVQRWTEPLPFLPLALVGDLLARLVWLGGGR